MAIKILITLEGSEQVKSALDNMAQSGEAFMQQFQGISAKAPLVDLSSNLEKVKPAIESSTQVAHSFAESLRVVVPALRLAGVEVGNFTGFSRLATVGLTGLAAAITGAVVVALANMEENTNRAKAALDSLFGSKAAGGKAFADLEQAASDLDTTIGGLSPALDSLTRAWQRFVQSTQGFKFVALSPEDLPLGNVKDLIGITETFVKIIRAAGQDEASAEKSAKAFFDTLKEGGKVTADALRQLDNRTVQLFAEAMGRGKISAEQFRSEVALSPIPMNQAVDALSRFGPQADKAFETDAIKSFKDEFQGLLNDIQRASRQKFGISVDQGLINFIRDLRKEVPGTAIDFKSIADTLAPVIKQLEKFRKEREAAIKPANIGAFQIQLPKDIFKQIPDDAQKAADQTQNIFTHAFDTMLAGTSPFAQAITRALDQLPEHVQTSLMMLPSFLEELKANFIAAFNSIVETATPILKKIVDVFIGIPTAIMDIWNTLVSDISESWNEITKSAQSAYDSIVSIFSKPPIDTSKWGNSIKSRVDTLINSARSAIQQIKEGIISPAGAAEFTPSPLLQQQQLPQQQQAQTQPIVAPFQEADNQIRTIWIALMDYISTSISELDFTPLTQALVAPFTNALPGIRDALIQVEQMIQEIVRQALAAAGIIQQLNQGGRPGGGGGGGFSFQEVASGGYIRGPGTTTSDSIPAWLSNREYVIQARAVDHYGPNLFAALNSMRLPKDLFSHFAIGGLAKALSNAMPRFASGGMATATASNGRSLTIVLDGQRFGLNGPADVIDQLERKAAMTGLASIGRPPGWVR